MTNLGLSVYAYKHLYIYRKVGYYMISF